MCHPHSMDTFISREEGASLLLTGSANAHHFLFVLRLERLLKPCDSVLGGQLSNSLPPTPLQVVGFPPAQERTLLSWMQNNAVLLYFLMLSAGEKEAPCTRFISVPRPLQTHACLFGPVAEEDVKTHVMLEENVRPPPPKRFPWFCLSGVCARKPDPVLRQSAGLCNTLVLRNSCFSLSNVERIT